MIGKARIDVWTPKLKQVTSTIGANADASYETATPARWVTLETPADLITNQKRGNALVGLSIEDSLYSPRTASIRITNRCNDYRTVYNNATTTTIANTTYTHVYNDSDGTAAVSGLAGTRKLPRNWGLYTNFFYPFQSIRVVDTETHLVLFSGRIYKIDKKYEDGMGSVVVLDCKDALEELNGISCQGLMKSVYFASTWRRSEIMTFALSLAYDYHGTNVEPAGGPSKSQLTPTTSHALATFNITDADYAASIAANTYSRFERSTTNIVHAITWRLADTGARSLLDELIRFAIAEPHDDETADDQFGYDLFVDSNIGFSNLNADVGPPQAQLNYVKRGDRLAKVGSDEEIQKPEKYGLTVHFPIAKTAIAQGHKTDATGTQVAKKIMHRAFSFDNPNDEMYTHGVLTYNAREDAQYENISGDSLSWIMKVEKIKKFEVIWVNHLNGQLDYEGKDIDDEWKRVPSSGVLPFTRSAETLDSYNIAGTKLANNVARIQYQSNPGNASSTADYHYVMLSDITDDFPTSNDGTDAYVVLKGDRSEKQFRFNAASEVAHLGRPSTVWNITKTFSTVQMNITHPDDLREKMASKLALASSEIRRGTYQISKAPYYWYDAKVISASSAGLTYGKRVAIKNINGNSSINITTFGFREGMLVHKMNSDFSAMVQVNNKDIYGYCFNMTDDSHMDIQLTYSQGFFVDDNIRLFIPIRAGDNLRVDNTIADVFGDHIVTETEYNEYMGPTTQIQSIGANEARKAGAASKRTLWTALSKMQAENTEIQRANLSNTKGNQFAKFDGTFIATAANEIGWYGAGGAGTVGNLTTIDGTTFQIVASDTSDTTHGLGSAGMTGTNKYVMYVDPDGENPSTNAYHIKTLINSSYIQDADNIHIATGSVGDPLASMNGEQVKASGDGSPLKVDGTTMIHNESMTSVLLKKGARAWTTDLDIRGTAFDAIAWNQATLTFANAETITISAGTHTSITPGTQYMYLNGVSGTLGPLLTPTHGTAIGDAKILLATVTVSTATDGNKPTIFPFNGKKPTLSAVVLAGDLILADHIRTGTISADRFDSNAQASITEKTKTHVGDNPPSWTPRTNDIWFDTDPQPTVIKIYDGSSWVLRNSNAPEGGGGNVKNVFTNPRLTGNPPDTANTGGNNLPSTGVLQYDLWMTSDTDQLLVAMHSTLNNSINAGEWVLKDDADAINYAGTSINGGLIQTQRIKLLQGGSLGIPTTGTPNNAFETTLTTIVDSGRNLASTISDTTTDPVTFLVEARGTGDKYLYAGDIILIDNEYLYVEHGGATALTAKRGWMSSTAATHGSGADIYKFDYPITNLTYSHIIMDNAGITGYSDEYTPEFSLSSVTGKGSFGGGSVVADAAGLTITDGLGGSGNQFLTFKAGSTTVMGIYASGNDITFTNTTATGNIRLSTGDEVQITGDLVPSSSGGNLGTSSKYWGWSEINYLDVNSIAARSQDYISLGDALRMTPSGSNSVPSYAFVADSTSGMRYITSGAYQGVALVGHGRYGLGFWSNGSSDYIDIGGTLDMNEHYIFDLALVKSLNGSSSAPAYSFMNASTSGMYLIQSGSYAGVYFSYSSSAKFSITSTVNYNYQKVYIGDYPDLAAGGFYLKSDSTGIILESSSTKRAKMDIQSLAFDTSKVYNLKPVSFRYRAQQVNENGVGLKDDNGLKLYTDVPAEGADALLQFGMIAEEVYEHIPELVALNTKANQPIGIDYPLLSVLLLEELKKLKARIEVLEGN